MGRDGVGVGGRGGGRVRVRVEVGMQVYNRIQVNSVNVGSEYQIQ